MSTQQRQIAEYRNYYDFSFVPTNMTFMNEMIICQFKDLTVRVTGNDGCMITLLILLNITKI